MATENNKTEVVVTKTSQILQLHEEGLTVGDISRKLDISYQHVYNTLKSKKVELPTRTTEGTKTAEIVKRFQDGETTGQIARAMNITFQHVYNTLRNKKLITSNK